MLRTWSRATASSAREKVPVRERDIAVVTGDRAGATVSGDERVLRRSIDVDLYDPDETVQGVLGGAVELRSAPEPERILKAGRDPGEAVAEDLAHPAGRDRRSSERAGRVHAGIEGGEVAATRQRAQPGHCIGRGDNAGCVGCQQRRTPEGARIARHEREPVADAELDRWRWAVAVVPDALARECEPDFRQSCQVAGPDPAERVHHRRRTRLERGDDPIHDHRFDAGASGEELVRPYDEQSPGLRPVKDPPDSAGVAPEQSKGVVPRLGRRHRLEQLGPHARRSAVDVSPAGDDS